MSVRFKLTADSIKKRCPLIQPGDVDKRGRPESRRIFWDTELPGFGLVVGKRDRSFIVQKDIQGRSVRVTLGRYPAWTPDEARKEARQVLAEMDRGVDPNARKREQEADRRRGEWERFTLADAVQEHVANMRAKRCAEASMDQVQEEMERHCSDWLTRPLIEIRRKDCIERHRRLTETAGPVQANRIMVVLRACWNSARKLYEELPEHPVRGVTLNDVQRRREPVTWDDLPEWWDSVQQIKNPIRRDLQLVLLFTGLRRTDACTIRWEHVDFDAGTIHVPKPKGGVDRAFTILACALVMGILARRQLENLGSFSTDKGWTFPTRDREGRVIPVQEPKEQRYVKRDDGSYAKVGRLPSPHRLRDTFATACRESGVGLYETKVLMNHTLPDDDVTEGYIRVSVDHLRGCVDRVAAFLLDKAGQSASPERASA